MAKILVVEDNEDINEILKNLLLGEHQVIQAYSGTEATLLFKQEIFDLVLLDIMLPGKDGGQVLQEIRQSSQVPVLMITAIGDKQSVTQYLLNGANDYITKPFDGDEVKARIQVQLRQTMSQELAGSKRQEYGHIELDSQTFTVSGPLGQVSLRKKEYDIFQLLLDHPKQIFTKEKLYEQIWQDVYLPGDNTLNAHLSNLRKKLKEVDDCHEYIETIWGLGIRLKEWQSS
ncbi:response regulator transcription factor [Vaginisenegalia massiliensis]|uniref:response regulator transcription factor n=1 Tax=Vaginisenegalia massiliensis TaxID=2058294 RepID=UPI000F52BC08|nr:response regulator transcription factor [Vaginisenegalia massiliensis]